MMPAAQWKDTPDVKRLAALSDGELYQNNFARNPFRAIQMRPEMFYSGADGTVAYAHDRVKPDEAIVNIKGKKFTPREALDDPKYQPDSLCIGVFMSKFDVHWNRMPTSGYTTDEHRTPHLFTPNSSMMAEEESVLEEGKSDDDALPYLFQNERRIVRVYNGQMGKRGQRYRMVQVAENDVDQVLDVDPGFMEQGERYGYVCFGSHWDLIIPLDTDNRFKILVKENMHVEAGIDPIVQLL